MPLIVIVCPEFRGRLGVASFSPNHEAAGFSSERRDDGQRPSFSGASGCLSPIAGLRDTVALWGMPSG
jgi:hypothetical protein